VLAVVLRDVFRSQSKDGADRPTVKVVTDPESLDWLRELYNRHSDQVREVIVRHGGPDIDAEDLVQEVFLAAHRKLEDLRRYEAPGGWLHLAALREVWKTRRRARMRSYLRLGIASIASEQELPDMAFERHEVARWVYAVLDRLPELQREALLLFHAEGLSALEIARMLRCPEETVRTRVFYARRSFVKAVQRLRRRDGDFLEMLLRGRDE
jgi:RNA polymerase sigma factor (sigma-70 family)